MAARKSAGKTSRKSTTKTSAKKKPGPKKKTGTKRGTKKAAGATKKASPAKKRSPAKKTAGKKAAGKKAAKRGTKRYSAKSQQKVGSAMHELKRGKLKSGRSGKAVKSRKQAIAIGLSEARKSGAKVPKKKSRGK
jgi:hypothetical protein